VEWLLLIVSDVEVSGDSMRDSTSVLKLWIIGSMAAQTIRWIPCGAFLGAACGALYGLPFAGLEALLEGETGRIIATTLYFAACGGVAGALVGCLAAVIHGETNSARDEFSGPVAPRTRRVTMAGKVAPPVRRPPVNRLAELSSVDRRHVERASSRNPSRN
jgi:hypothetical protein